MQFVHVRYIVVGIFNIELSWYRIAYNYNKRNKIQMKTRTRQEIEQDKTRQNRAYIDKNNNSNNKKLRTSHKKGGC